MNNLELSHRQQLELLTSLGARGEVPLKFSYLNEGAEHWVRLGEQRLSKGGINLMEYNLLTKRVGDILNTFPSDKTVNIIDIGCGDGSPVFPIIDSLIERKQKFNYIPIDISAEMLEIAKKKFLIKYPGVNIFPHQLDFELGNFTDVVYEHKTGDAVNLMLFLGSTLGNFSDRRRVLTNFRDSMSVNDYLLLGMELINFSKVENLVPHYTNEVVVDLVYTLPKKIGIDLESSKPEVLWNERKNQIEVLANMTKDLKIDIEKETVNLKKNEKVLLARSVKFNEASFTDLLSAVDLRNELLTVNEDRSYLLTLVQPTRYRV